VGRAVQDVVAVAVAVQVEQREELQAELLQAELTAEGEALEILPRVAAQAHVSHSQAA
jgi:hypothetical protein